MSRISSLTETTGLSSPQSSGTARGAGDGFDDEHVVIETPRATRPANMARDLQMRTPDISPAAFLDADQMGSVLAPTTDACHAVATLTDSRAARRGASYQVPQRLHT